MRWRNRTWLVGKISEPIPVPGKSPFKLPARDAETLANWVEAAVDRGAVLFVGAGWTRNAIAAPRVRGTDSGAASPLLWSELANRFRDALGGEFEVGWATDPLWLAELYRQRHGSEALSRLLEEAVPDDRLLPGPLHECLLGVPWRAVLTTNYDTLLERTFAPRRRVCVSVDDVDLVRSASANALEVIHLHGVLGRPETIVLAYEDYRSYPQRHPGMLAKVRQLLLQHPVLFLGFGVTDPNFLQWSGWLADVVGEHKNPWVTLTMDPQPALPHARYWGTRLEFVSIRPFRQFESVVPAVFESTRPGL